MTQLFSRHLDAGAVVYDCMDELSADPRLMEPEVELLNEADLVFTGGQSLFEAKRYRPSAVHCFPSSVDRAPFAQARNDIQGPLDQAKIAGPRLGYFGVIDERLDIDLVATVARS